MSLPISLSPDLLRRLTWLRRAIRPVAGRADVDDVVQQTLLRAVETEATTVRHPRALLVTIARRIAIDEGRRARVRGGPAAALDELPDHAAPWTSPDQESALLLKQVILGLPSLYRDVFILNRFVGLTYAEIARRQGVSVKTIEYRMSRAIALCQAALRD